MNEVLLYGYIWDESARQFILDMQNVSGDALKVRVNSPGGDVDSGWGMVAKFSEFPGKKMLFNDGGAYSMAAVAFLYADNAEATDVSRFMFHRASYGDWFENSPWFDEDTAAHLEMVNNSLRAAMEAKFGEEKWVEVTGVSFDHLFSMSGQKDVYLSADQALQLGIIQKIVKLTPEKKTTADASFFRAAASSGGVLPYASRLAAAQTAAANTHKQISKINTMTVAELLAAHPTVYAEILADGVTQGVAQERERASAFAVFAADAPEAVQAGITDGSAPNIAELARAAREKAVAAAPNAALQTLATESAQTSTAVASANATTEEGTTPPSAVEAFQAKMEALSPTNLSKK